MVKLCPLCGPMLSAFCMVISVWGVFFLGLLGLFFSTQAVNLFPDLHFSEENPSVDQIGEKYHDKAVQCWIAAGMYLVTFIFVFFQNRFNAQQIF